MEELILCENLGMWDKHMQVVWYVFETEYMYIVVSLNICSVVGNCDCIWGLWIVVCIIVCVCIQGAWPFAGMFVAAMHLYFY